MSRRPARAVSFAAFALGLALLVRPPAATGQPPKAVVVPPAPQAPTLTSPANLGGKRGSTVELVLTGTNLADPTAVLLGFDGKVTIPTDNKNGTEPGKLRISVEIPGRTPIGLYTIRVATKNGVSNFRPFVVDDLPEVPEADNNRSKDTAQLLSPPCVVTGRTDPEMSDFFLVKVAAGERLTFEVLARRLGSPLDPIILMHDAKTKREIIDLYADETFGLQSDCRLTHTFKEAGEFLIEVRHSEHKGGADHHYRLRVGDFPGVTTAFPLVIQRGTKAEIAFAGPDRVMALPVQAPTDATLPVMYASPRWKADGIRGWPVPVWLSDDPQSVEQEPNNEPAKANKLPVPGGVSAKFETAKDVDCFAFPGKKGQKLVLTALTYEVNAPTEVLLKVLDAKGTELAKSNPQQATARVEFTPAADGEYVVACEHTNYLHGPNEVYHLSVRPATPDFDIALSLDRYETPAGGGTAVLATITRTNGFNGPIELAVAGDELLGGKVTVPAGQTTAVMPLTIGEDAKPGAFTFRVKGTAKIDGAEVVRYGSLLDAVKANMAGIPNPPPELLTGCAVAVVQKPPFDLAFTVEPEKIEKGKAGKVVVEATRAEKFDEVINLAPLFVPPNVTPTPKPVAKGQAKGEVGLAVTPTAAVGQQPVLIRGTAKVGGKDFAVTPPPVTIEVIEAKKKEEPKKDDKTDKK